MLDAKRRKLITARLAEKLDVETLCQAIEGIFSDPWFVDKKHLITPDLCFRDAEHVERYAAKAPPPPPDWSKDDFHERLKAAAARFSKPTEDDRERQRADVADACSFAARALNAFQNATGDWPKGEA